MSLPRRRFLQTTLLTGAGLSVGMGSRWVADQKSDPAPTPTKDGKPLKILILGGTAFLGPACTDAAIARGHSVTLFNRGRLESIRKDQGRSGVVPQNVEVLFGNRDPEKSADDWKDDPKQNRSGSQKDPNSPKGLSALKGRTWDAVIDTSGYWPRMVKASAELLAPSVKQYVFISTLSVYAKTDSPITEETPLATLADPKTEEFGAQYENYGPGKAACEAAAEAAMPGRVTNIRPGFIVGPRDSSRRFIYWPVRVRRGGEMLLPGSPDDPIQIIDVRDLAEWVVHCVEQGVVGTFNATGPAETLSMKAMVEGCKKGCASDATFTWADIEFLGAHGLQDNDFPLYVQPSGEGAGFHRCSIRRALSKGLKFRPVDQTAKATLEWYDSLPPEIQTGVTSFSLTEDREKAMLKAWKDRAK